VEVFGNIPLLHAGRPSVRESARLVGAFKDVRLAIRPCFPSGETIAFEVVNTTPRAGTTFVAGNLALSFAGAGFRTVLVDAGATQPGVAATLGVSAMPGVSDYLSGGCNIVDILRGTLYDRLFVVPSGSALAGAGAVDATRRDRLTHALGAQFDVVIVDRAAAADVAASTAGSELYDAYLLVTSLASDDAAVVPSEHDAKGARHEVRILGTVNNFVP
jgi:Mrp family chromosome partitioning ATPase